MSTLYEYSTGYIDDEVVYRKFIDFMLSKSDAFSVIYFRYKETDKVKRTIREMSDELKPYKLMSGRVTEWPSNMTSNENNHVYKMVLYKSDLDAAKILYKPGALFNWDYPKYPMDICFFRNNREFLSVCSHERYSSIYLRNEEETEELKSIGVHLVFEREVKEEQLFYQPYSKQDKNKRGQKEWGSTEPEVIYLDVPFEFIGKEFSRSEIEEMCKNSLSKRGVPFTQEKVDFLVDGSVRHGWFKLKE